MIEFKKHSGIFSFEVLHELPISIEQAWTFFSDPNNLSKITPDNMGFHITSKPQREMYEGQLITYQIGIFPFIKNNWVTEITAVKHQHYFIDEQRFGPYILWHHEHHFASQKNGVLMTDKIFFKLPFGVLGNLAFHLFVKKQLSRIFSFRFDKLNLMFGTPHKQ